METSGCVEICLGCQIIIVLPAGHKPEKEISTFRPLGLILWTLLHAQGRLLKQWLQCSRHQGLKRPHRPTRLFSIHQRSLISTPSDLTTTMSLVVTRESTFRSSLCVSRASRTPQSPLLSSHVIASRPCYKCNSIERKVHVV